MIEAATGRYDVVSELESTWPSVPGIPVSTVSDAISSDGCRRTLQMMGAATPATKGPA